jgi:hypothetical protein
MTDDDELINVMTFEAACSIFEQLQNRCIIYPDDEDQDLYDSYRKALLLVDHIRKKLGARTGSKIWVSQL